MPALIKNFVLDTANAPGTSATINLAGAPAGRLSFAVFSSGSNVYYFMDDGTQAEWGYGVFTAGSPNTLTRTVIGNTSGTTARLNFTGATRVYNEPPAEQAIYLDTANNLALPGTLSTVNGATIGGASSVGGALNISPGGSANQAVNYGQFGGTIGAAAAFQTPGGPLIRMGSGSTSSGNATVSFAAFPNNFRGGIAIANIAGPSGSGIMTCEPLNLSSCKFHSIDTGGSPTSVPFFYVVWGD